MDRIADASQRRTFFRLITIIGVLALLAFGISSCNLPDLGGLLDSGGSEDAPDPVVISPTPSPTPTQAPAVQSREVILWVPPQFDPDSGTTDGNLFLSRLDEFITRRPQTEIQVRIKALDGEFGLLESLRLADAAAPALMPDLIALPRTLMEQAYREGLIMTLDEIPGSNGEELYDYARELALVEGNPAGYPFAGDLLGWAYLSEGDSPPPQDWDALLEAQKAVAFPASDPRSLVTLALYQSLGAALVDENGDPQIDPEAMSEVLSFYQNAQTAGVMPFWLTQFETDAQAWGSFQDRKSTLAISWSSLILSSESSNTALAALPTKDSRAFSYADGWVWCVVPSNPGTESVAGELAEFLTAESYLAIWGIEAGYLPVQTAAVENWADSPHYSTLQQVLPAAVLLPDSSLVDPVGSQVKDAVVAVLKDQVAPEEALELLGDLLPAGDQ